MADKQAGLARLREAQALLRAQGRVTGKKRLLDDGDQNIGNALRIPPFPSNNQFPAVLFPQTNPDRILFLDALSPTGQTITIGLTASLVLRSALDLAAATQITGIIEFGNGAQFTRIEVDIPIGPTRGTTIGVPAFSYFEPEDGVTLVTVPAGTLRVYARNDSKLIVPTIAGLVGGPAGAVPGPIAPPVGTEENPFAADVLVKAFVTYYSIRGSFLLPTKTNYIGRTLAGQSISYINAAGNAYLIPPLAKRFKIMRVAGGAMPAVTGTIYDQNGMALELFSVPAGAISPFFELPGAAHRIGLLFTLGASGTAALAFEIGA